MVSLTFKCFFVTTLKISIYFKLFQPRVVALISMFISHFGSIYIVSLNSNGSCDVENFLDFAQFRPHSALLQSSEKVNILQIVPEYINSIDFHISFVIRVSLHLFTYLKWFL